MLQYSCLRPYLCESLCRWTRILTSAKCKKWIQALVNYSTPKCPVAAVELEWRVPPWKIATGWLVAKVPVYWNAWRYTAPNLHTSWLITPTRQHVCKKFNRSVSIFCWRRQCPLVCSPHTRVILYDAYKLTHTCWRVYVGRQHECKKFNRYVIFFADGSSVSLYAAPIHALSCMIHTSWRIHADACM